MENKNALLVILDGWGHGQDPKVSAIAQADTPYIDSLYENYPNSELITFGELVGLPEGQMGNSEVGHLNIGAGRIVYQDFARINKSIKENTLAENSVLLELLEKTRDSDKALHFIGLLSDGGVHSHINHLKALCDIAVDQGLSKIYIHAFMDGRDTSPTGGLGYLEDLQKHIRNQPIEIASLIGRYYAMDRDQRWERVKEAYDLLVNGKGQPTEDLCEALEQSYQQEITDEFIKPLVATRAGNPVAKIEEGDSVLFFNFRTDRPRELTEVLTQKDMPDFEMKKLGLNFATMTRYDDKFKKVSVLFTKEDLKETLGEVLAKNGRTQVRIAETEKYPHVTFFFSGGREKEFENERRILIASPKVATYDLQPEMSAEEITDQITADIEKNTPNFICLNYANADMVGHTGDFKAAQKAAKTVDSCLERLIKKALKFNYDCIVIADHGNSDYMINEDGTPHTAHTVNPVPCFYISNTIEGVELKDGKLADVAPTILSLLSIDQPALMDGENLVVKSKVLS